MKSIEERADRAIYEPTDGHPLKACEVVAFARGYELGANEQKAIDDALWLKKAYKWIKENVECGVHPQSAYGFADRFLRAMEEE